MHADPDLNPDPDTKWKLDLEVSALAHRFLESPADTCVYLGIWSGSSACHFKYYFSPEKTRGQNVKGDDNILSSVTKDIQFIYSTVVL